MFSVMRLMYFKLKCTSLLVKYWSYGCYYGWLGYYRDQHPSLFNIFQQNLEVISCCKLRCLSHDVENSINQKRPGPTCPWIPLSRLTLSHSAQQQNNARSGRDQLALSLHHPHATSPQFFTAAMNSARHKNACVFLYRRGPGRGQPSAIVRLKSLAHQPPLLSPALQRSFLPIEVP